MFLCGKHTLSVTFGIAAQLAAICMTASLGSRPFFLIFFICFCKFKDMTAPQHAHSSTLFSYCPILSLKYRPGMAAATSTSLFVTDRYWGVAMYFSIGAMFFKAVSMMLGAGIFHVSLHIPCRITYIVASSIYSHTRQQRVQVVVDFMPLVYVIYHQALLSLLDVHFQSLIGAGKCNKHLY